MRITAIVFFALGVLVFGALSASLAPSWRTDSLVWLYGALCLLFAAMVAELVSQGWQGRRQGDKGLVSQQNRAEELIARSYPTGRARHRGTGRLFSLGPVVFIERSKTIAVCYHGGPLSWVRPMNEFIEQFEAE